MFRLALLFAAALQVTVAFQPMTIKPSLSALPLHTSLSDDHDMTATDRRNFVGSSLFFFVTAAVAPAYAEENAVTVDYKAVANDVADLVRGDPDKGPTLVRLAWHSSYVPNTN